MLSYSEQMLRALEDKDMAQAQVNLQKALRNDEPEFLLDLAEELMALGYLEEAKMIYTSLYQRFPEKDEVKIPLAEIAIEEDSLDDALDYLTSIPNTSEAYPQSLLVQADLYQLLEIPEVTEEKLKELARLLPDELIPKFAQAEFYYAAGQFEKAFAQYQQLLDLGEKSLNGILIEERMGAVLAFLGEFEEAVPYLEKALEEEATEERLYQLGMVYAQLHENQRAIELFKQTQSLDPHFSQSYYPLAELLKQENRLEEAYEVVCRGIEENPYSVLLYHLASELAYSLHKPDEAEEFLRNSLRLEEDGELSLLKLSSFLLLEERYEDALDVLEQLEDTEYPLAIWNFAQAYNGIEDFANAGSYYAKAAPFLMQEPEFIKEYGLFLREDGQNAEAQKYFKIYVEMVPGDLEIISLLEHTGDFS